MEGTYAGVAANSTIIKSRNVENSIEQSNKKLEVNEMEGRYRKAHTSREN